MTDLTLTRIADALEKLVDAYAQAQRRDHYALTDQPETEWNFNEVRLRREVMPWEGALDAGSCDCARRDAYAANEARQREEAEPDPLDEDDHRDRVDGSGDRWSRRSISWCRGDCPCPSGAWALGAINHGFGPLTFAPDASPAPQDAAQDAAEGEGDAVEGAGAAGPNLNVQMAWVPPHTTPEGRRRLSAAGYMPEVTRKDMLSAIRNGVDLEGMEFPPATVGGLVESGECSAACLAASGDPYGCDCACHGYYHGAAYDQQVEGRERFGATS